MVVMVNGKPKKEHYRSFNITTVKHGNIDDYQSLSEVLKRRLRYLKPAEYTSEEYWKNKGYTFSKITKKNLSLFLTTQELFGRKMTKEEIDEKNYLCVKYEESFTIILHGTVQHTSLILSIQSQEENPTLALALVLKKIKTMKEKKAYISIQKKDEDLFSEHGFRYVITPPKWLEKEKEDEIWMLFDAKENAIDPSFSSMPDLLLIDGGKGQLSSIVKVLSDLALSIPVIGLAKREEEIFLPHQEESIKLGNTSEARLLIQRLRDEAHRFANDRRERRLDAIMTRSKLDEISGIGEETKAKLLKKFGGADAALKATDDELRIILSESQLKTLREKFPSP